MKIEFVNHASFILEVGKIRIISDPWIEGSVFDNSWSLLLPSKFKFSDFSNITHIWFSHEHPDHFFPPNLKLIDEAVRKNITVLYKYTQDKKVYNYCKNMGFKVVELPKMDWFELSDSIKLKCINWYDDSLLMIETPGGNILNLNDCAIKSKVDAERLRAQLLPKVDILFTQYSYASYVGETLEQRRKAALNKFEEIATQISVFMPAKVIPFASNVWFSHSENFYMNNGINKMRDAFNFIKTNFFQVEVLVMAPGDVYSPSDNYENFNSLSKYDEAYEFVSKRDRGASKFVTEKTLLELGNSFSDRLRTLHYHRLFSILGIVKPLKIYVNDLNSKFELTLNHFVKISDIEQCHISMSSSALEFVFKFDYGFNTLSVNGRYTLLEPSNESRLNSFISLGDALNHGRRSYIDLFKSFLNRIKLKFKG